ncbi:phenylacetate-CoA oxygenase subunit PaaJ [Segetibacter sp. 3557_3]|uniref:1,2-phenylacetyl-CoA epoxidase subunit PaaD n=1 Tax=Segetibacter sp. 3557_3 TaxID=2547429 RepID=UPI0010586D91|nr:1,2-phenylacetyl-CoA epoxidase subunit PaaD [Segetibacter sp. 3557_3]TDH23073.1 phenylacetate-CoA oxygenase subunit PaaJ [Segetibacter sp. 3557_3]
MNSATAIPGRIYDILETVKDPELPVLSILDLGIVREVHLPDENDSRKINIVITPTYSGCPAMDLIALQVRVALLQHGFKDVQVTTSLSPAWTTAWMTHNGKEKLKAYGIAPPNAVHSVCSPDAFQADEAVQCPRCDSYHTRLISRFASTACKSMYQCNDCKEPFDYFKCH